MPTPFVGRRTELETITQLVASARQRRTPVAALVTGAPGTGKSRLLSEIHARVEIRRSVRLVGFEPIQSVPLAAAGELLRSLVRVPGSGRDLDLLVFGQAGHQAREPLQIFEGAHRALSAAGPMLLVVDDLQWVDDLTIGLIHYLLRAASSSGNPLILVAAARPSPTTATFRAGLDSALGPDAHAFLDLGPLALADGLVLVRAIDGRLDDASAGQLWRRAGGSPFWIESLVRGGGTIEVEHLILERLAAIGSDAAVLLSALAVGARPYMVDELARVLDWDGERLRHAARELVARGLAVQAGSRLGTAHDLIREAAAPDVPSSTRRTLRARFAGVIEDGAGDDLQLLLEALAHRAAAGLPTTELALRLVGAPQRRLVGSAGLSVLSAIANRMQPGSLDQLRLDAALGELAATLGEQELALERWGLVSEHSPDPLQRQQAEIASARSAYALRRSGDARAHLRLARELTPMIAETAETVAAATTIDALQADVELWLDHDTAAGRRTAGRALATARKMAAAAGGAEHLPPISRRAYLAAFQAASDAAMQGDRAADVVQLGEALEPIARDLDEETYLRVLMRTAFSLLPLGRVREAEARYRQAWDVSKEAILPAVTIEAGIGLARALSHMGRLKEAMTVATDTADLETRLRDAPRKWGNAPSTLHRIELSLGDSASALRALRADVQAEPDPHFQVAMHQLIATWQARTEGRRRAGEVETELAAAREASALARCPRCAGELSLTSVELLARIGRVDEARRELAVFDDEHPGGTYLMREVWRARATSAIAAADGDTATATSLLEAVATWTEGADLREDLLWAYLDLGRNFAGIDRARAVDSFTKAAALAAEIGAVSQERLSTRELRRLGVRAWRRGRVGADTPIAGLSSRELEVARSVADGASNREIAQTLLISPKTVERHVTNVLAKLGLRNRTELATVVRSIPPVRDLPDDRRTAAS
jgi:DNA-binding CsgD family transcriptional regulator